LDETLIHSLRDGDGEEDDFNYRYDDENLMPRDKL
jgi:Dullard-like phosphatase family protein